MSSSSRESGIKSTADGSSPEHPDRFYPHCQQRQQYDLPLDLSVTSSSSLPRQRIDNNEPADGARRGSVTSFRRDYGSLLSLVDDNLPLPSHADCGVMSRCHDNDNPFSAFSFVDKASPLLSSAPWSLQLPPPYVFSHSHQYTSVPVIPLTQHPAPAADTSMRLPEPAKQLLTSWYETHVRHPYPQPDELSHLVMMTGQSRRKVLKWLANRRARTGNTLPHNGSVHPRKIIKIRQLRRLAEEKGPRPDQQLATRRSRQRSLRFLPESVVDGLQRWYDDHLGYPYPTDSEKRHLAEQLGTTVVKVTNWFANKRNRSGHGKSQNFRYGTAPIATTNQSASTASALDWQNNWTVPPHSLSVSTLAQTSQWNEQRNLL